MIETHHMRDKDIINTLKYTESKRQELLNLMFDSKMQGSSIENIANLVADILNNLTKCFDYCANDIYNKCVSPHLEQKDKRSVKVYFPFYKDQLMNKSNPFNLLVTYNKAIYDFLFEIAERSEKNELISDTIIPYSTAREVRRLVNADKHNKIIEVDNQGPSELLAKSKIGNIIMKEDSINQKGWKVELFPNQEKTTKVSKSYRLVENDQEVADFCSFAQWNTQQILDRIYRKFFGVKIILCG